MNITVPDQKKVIEHYGEEPQSMIHMEECAELAQAVSKMRRTHGKWRDGCKEYNNLVEEMADVLICMEQMKEMYGISDYTIQEEVNAKCRREEGRIHDAA